MLFSFGGLLLNVLFGYFILENNVFICIKVLVSGGQRRKNDDGTNSNGVAKNFAETTTSIADILKDGGQITLPLNDETNQSSVKKVSDILSTLECDGYFITQFLY